MGDLDDFFAKKDKKKGKGKPKMVAASLFDDMKKENEAKKEKLKKKQELENNEQTPDVLKKTKEDDDWEDFDDPSDLNLEGLKVVNLASESRGPDAGGGGAGGGGGTAGDGGDGGDGTGAADDPWRRKAAEAAAATAAAAAAAVTDTQASADTDAGATSADTATAATAADAPAEAAQPAGRPRYEPPHKRTAAAAVSGGGGSSSGSRPGSDLFAARPLPRGVRRDKNAPNINDVEEFPTLAPSGVEEDDRTGRVGGGSSGGQGQVDNRPFESVKGPAGRGGAPPMAKSSVGGVGGGSGGTAKPESVSVSNRWAALGEDATS